MTEPENSGRNQDGTFAPGVSGNPAGKPKGTRHLATRAVENLLEGEAEALTRKAVELALAGDVQALRVCLDRITPTRRSRPVNLDLPRIETAADIAQALSAVLAAIADGTIDPDEGAIITGVIEAKRKAIETVELDARLTRLEKSAGEKSR